MRNIPVHIQVAKQKPIDICLNYLFFIPQSALSLSFITHASENIPSTQTFILYHAQHVLTKYDIMPQNLLLSVNIKANSQTDLVLVSNKRGKWT